MKIRHKQSGVVLEGQFCTLGEATDYGTRSYYVPVGTGYHSEYDRREWELVKPEPQWVDVTGECEAHDEFGQFVTHKGRGILTEVLNGYRLRKVKCFFGYCSSIEGDAFIIEQRQP